MKRNSLFICLTLIIAGCNPNYCPVPPEPIPAEIILSSKSEVHDTFVNSAFPTEADGSDERFVIAAASWSGIPGIDRAYLRFDLSSITPAMAKKIKSAVLTLYADTTDIVIYGVPLGHNQLSGHNDMSIRRIIEPWDEHTLTWNTQPATDGVGQLSIPASTSRDQHYVIDITHFILNDINNPVKNHGIMFKLNNENPYRAVSFYSSDHIFAPALGPQLKITFAQDDEK